MRRYHSSPSIPFHIARVHGACEPAGSRTDGLNASVAKAGASDHQKPLENAPTAFRVFLWSLWVAGLAVGAGLALELNGMMYQGLFAQAAGFFIAGVAVICHPGEGENHE